MEKHIWKDLEVVEGVVKGKSELYTYLKKNHKTVFVNTNDKIQVEKTTAMNVVPLSNSVEFVDANPFVKIQLKNERIQHI